MLQDFTGVAALVDLASMRDIVASKHEDPSLVDSKCPADLVVDHAVQVDYSYIEKLVAKQQKEIESSASANATYMAHNTFPPYCPPYNGEVFYQGYFPPPPMMEVAGAQAMPQPHPPTPVNLGKD